MNEFRTEKYRLRSRRVSSINLDDQCGPWLTQLAERSGEHRMDVLGCAVGAVPSRLRGTKKRLAVQEVLRRWIEKGEAPNARKRASACAAKFRERAECLLVLGDTNGADDLLDAAALADQVADGDLDARKALARKLNAMKPKAKEAERNMIRVNAEARVEERRAALIRAE